MSNFVINSYRFAPTLTNEKSVELDGTNDYFNDIYTVNSADSTISFWLYRDNTSASHRVLTLAATPWDSDYQTYIQVRGASVSEALDIELRLRSAGVDQKWISWTTSINATTWYHIVLSTDGTTWECWLDGTELTTRSKNTGSTESYGLDDCHTDGVDEWQWGARDNGTSTANELPGNLDEISVWNTQRTVSELYNSGTPPDLSSLTNYSTECECWLRCGDDAGDTNTTIIDQTTNNRDHTHQNNDSDPYEANVP